MHTQHHLAEQVWSILQSPPQGLPPAPSGYLAMVPRQQNRGNLPPLEHTRASEVRIVQKARLKRLLGEGRFVAHHPGDQSPHHINDHHGGQLPPGEDVVPKGDLFIYEGPNSVVNPFVVATQNNQSLITQQLMGFRLIKRPARGGGQNHPRERTFPTLGRQCPSYHIHLHHHASPPTVGGIVGHSMATFCPITQVVDVHLQQPTLTPAPDHTHAQGGSHHLRKQG